MRKDIVKITMDSFAIYTITFMYPEVVLADSSVTLLHSRQQKKTTISCSILADSVSNSCK